MQTYPHTRDLVLVGGGHAHALVLLRWAMNPLPGARLTLIDPNPVAPYTGMLPGHIAGHYPRAALEMDLVRLARHAGARLILGRAEGLDPDAGQVRVAGRPPIGFDALSLDIGITSDLPDLAGFAEHGVAAKPLGTYAERWDSFVAAVEGGQVPADIVVLGAGVGGVELALAMAHRLARHKPRITIVDQGRALPHLGIGARANLILRLATTGIMLLEEQVAARVDADGVTLADGNRISAALVLAAAGARPQGWLRDTGLKLSDGYVVIDRQLRAAGHDAIFAVGDCAHMVESPRPKAGVFAVRQAPILLHNLRAVLSGGSLHSYRPQRDYLKLISLGGQSALAEKWGLPVSGPWLWRLKDRIDRRFMRMFHSLPAMPAPAIPRKAAADLPGMLARGPLCGGCGAKLGPDVLRNALRNLPHTRADVVMGAGDDAAVLGFGPVRQVLATDHLRAVTDDPWLMAQIAAVHALGDIWAMGAAPQLALASLTLPRAGEPVQARIMAEIMDGAVQVMRAAGADIGGGHSTQGAELVIGFTVTGLAGPRLLTKAGGQPGDALILTKPIGSGVLLAAEMQRRADGRDIAALWPALVQGQATAAALLTPVARAMTDVTGFGLAGHLDEMLRPEVSQPDGLRAELDLSAIPLFAGALELAAAGLASSVAPANRAALLGRIDAPQTPRAALLFDPQTAGGLLAAVPAAQADTVLRAVIDAGHGAAIIGHLLPPGDGPAITAR